MATKSVPTCATCNEAYDGSVKYSFLGFRSFVCPSCESQNKLGLVGQTRVVYWVFFIGFLFSSIVTIADGSFLIPGIFVIGAAWGLIADYQFRKQRREENAP